ncbi:MAG TPA: nicotinate-nucleotide diphosphorylase (carboxylating), partial [Polyangiaceae bacterium]
MLLPALIGPVILRALAEDLEGGDLTTEATVAEGTLAIGRAEARGEIVVCGGDVFRAVFAHVDPTLEVSIEVVDGERAVRGDVLWTVRGSARSVLMGERT